MGRGAIPSRRGFSRGAMRHPGVSGITRPFGRLSRGRGQVLHVLLSRSPLASLRRGVPFDLHVLGAPPAFILSQDRTLRSDVLGTRERTDQILRFEPSRPVSAMSFNSDPLGQGTRRECVHSTSFVKNLSYSLSWLSALSGRGIRFSRFAALGRARCPAAARGVNIRSIPTGRGGNRLVHGSFTTRHRRHFSPCWTFY